MVRGSCVIQSVIAVYSSPQFRPADLLAPVSKREADIAAANACVAARFAA